MDERRCGDVAAKSKEQEARMSGSWSGEQHQSSSFVGNHHPTSRAAELISLEVNWPGVVLQLEP